jgi:DNA (cytosine-5)-methyltransferase 1
MTKSGRKQFAELRDDGVAGCIRTPGGGSSKQILAFVERGILKTRLMTAREAARLMGLDDSYVLPENQNDALHFVGDGVAVPIVRYLSETLFLPILSANLVEVAA